MRKNNGIQFFNSLFWSSVAVVINYIITFLLTSYITETFGADVYGFVSLSKTVANYALIITTALNSFASRFISVAYHNEDYKSANIYYNSVFFGNIGLGGVILAVSTFLIFFLQYLISIPTGIEKDVKILFFLAIINFVVFSSTTAFNVAPLIRNRVDITGIIRSFSYLSEGVFLLLVFRLVNPKIYYVSLGTLVASTLNLVVNYLATKKLTPQLHINIKHISINAIKNLFVNGIWYSINSVGNLLNTGLDLLISNIFLSALEMGQLAIVKNISVIFSTLFQTVSGQLNPLLLKAYSHDDKNELKRLFIIGMKICGLFGNLAFAGFLAYGEIYYKLWTPSQDSSFLHHLTIITVGASMIEGAICILNFSYILTLKNKIPCLSAIVSGSLNVVSMIILLKFCNSGLYGIVGTTTVLSWIGGLLFTPMYSAHILGFSKTTFYPALFKNVLSCLALSLICKLLSLVFMPYNWVTLILSALLCCIICFPIHILISFNKSEIKTFKTLFLKKNI